MKKQIALSNHEVEIVRNILQRHLPVKATVWLFGSRVTGFAKKFSDIDLLIDIGSPISLNLIAKLNNDFEESSLPYKVDIVDAGTISDDFRKLIDSQKILFWP
ncbi:MAG: DNA polymerase beta protein [uncultured bacterium]|nr:MAG: DNA polymerase beta protein [uncultured bacterium]